MYSASLFLSLNQNKTGLLKKKTLQVELNDFVGKTKNWTFVSLFHVKTKILRPNKDPLDTMVVVQLSWF